MGYSRTVSYIRIDTCWANCCVYLHGGGGMSPVAYALFTYLQQQPAGGKLVMEELTSQIRASKTAIRAAFEELSAEGLVQYTQEG